MAWKVKITVLREGVSYLQDEFTHSPITLGGLPESDLVLDDPFVSGQHAVVMVSRGQMVIRDLSRNGCFIDDQRIGERDLGHQATVDIPPFRLQLTFEQDKQARQTMVHSNLDAALEAAKRELMTEGGWNEDPPGPAQPSHPPSFGPPPTTTPTAQPPPLPAWPVAPAAEQPVGEPADLSQGTEPMGSVPLPTEEEARVDEPAVSSDPAATTTLVDGPRGSSIEVLEGFTEMHGLALALGEEMSIGRADTADLWIPVETVSRRHVVIRRQPTGNYLIEDSDSANGTYVNDQRVTTRDLHGGDVIRIGAVQLRFNSESSTELPTRTLADSTPDSPPASPPEAMPAPPAPELGQEQPAEPEAEVSDHRSTEPDSDLESFHFQRRALSSDGTTIVITASGRIDGYNYTQLGDSLASTIDAGGRHLVLDLTAVEYLGHTGLGVLVRCQSRLRRLRGGLSLVGPNDRIRDALMLTRLDTLFSGRIYPDQDAALRDLA